MNYFQKKKLAFMSIVNRVKGFVRTITGALPLTLEGCVDEESIIDYTLYGQSVQNGTPTPETPIEVESVGEKTRNLITATDGYIVNYGTEGYIKYDAKTQVFTIQGSALKEYVYLPETIPSGTTTSIFVEIVNDDYEIVKDTLVIGGYGIVSSWQNSLAFSATSQKKQSRVYTITKDTDRICIFVDANASVKNVQVRITYAVCDTEFTEYEPYGYKIPIKVSGKNLFDISSVNKMYNSSGGDISAKLTIEDGVLRNKYGAYAGSAYIPCNITTLSAGTYTLSCEVSGATTGYIGMYINKVDRRTVFKNPNGVDWGKISYKFTLEEESTITGIQLQGFGDASNYLQLEIYFRNIQIEESGTATDYEPYHEPITTNIYLDEPLGEGQSINYKKDGLPTIPTFKGTSIISTDTTIQPSNAEITYYSNVKE